MKKISILIFSLIAFLSFSQNTDFDNNIRKMIEVQGSKQNMETVMNQMIQMQLENHPEIDIEFWDRFKRDISKNSFSNYIDLVIPIYKKYLTEDEVQAIIDFYESEAGKSLISKFPMILQETMEIGETYAKEIAIKIIQDIENEKTNNFEKINSNCEAFKEGKFKHILSDSSIVIIERNNKFQFEYIDGTTTKYKIEWLNDCKYSLELIKTDNEMIEKNKEFVILTNIYETGEDFYKYIGTIEGLDIKMKGIIYKIE